MSPVIVSMIRDLRFAARQLRKAPGFTATVLCTLALCIGANTAIYSVVDAVLLRPLPYPEPDRLALMVFDAHSARGSSTSDSQDGPTWEAVRDHATLLEPAIDGQSQGVNLSGTSTNAGRAEYVKQYSVTAGYFHVMGVPPFLGREFTRTEDAPGGAAVVVLGYPAWQRLFHGDPGAIGKAILLRGEPYTVVGVMPEGFRTQTPADLYTPRRPSNTGEGQGANYTLVARLKPGVTLAAAETQLEVVAKPVIEHNMGKDVVVHTRLVPMQQGLTADLQSALYGSWAAVGVVLLIGCVNIAGLLLARSAVRAREIATRMAVGASRSAIIRQLLAESLLLALAGGALGMIVGYAGIQGLTALEAEGINYWHPVTLNWRVMLAMLGVSLVTSLIFGLAPAFATSRVDLRSVLVEGGRGAAGGSRHWSRRALIVAEVALSLMLLIDAGLLVRTLERLEGLRPGFDPHNVMSASLSLQDARYQTGTAVNKLYDESLRRIRQSPEVEAAGIGLTLPYQRPLNMGFKVADGPNADGKDKPMDFIYVTPGYLEALRIPLVSGRVISEADRAGTEGVVVINEAFARRFLKDQEPVGSHLKMGGELSRIVGVVGDTQQHSGIGWYGPMSATPTVYTPAAQESDKFFQLIHTWFSPKWVVRTRSTPGPALQHSIEAAVQAIDPLLPFAKFESLEDVQYSAFKSQRYQATIFSTLAGLAMFLAAIGLFGLISHSVTERTREMGIRMALGSSIARAMWTVIRPAVWLTLFGVGAGAILAQWSTALVKDLLFGVPAGDPTTFLLVSAALLVVALLASAIPSLRLLRLDPAVTLRAE
jgi:predicted permease